MLSPPSERYSESEVLPGIARVLHEQFGEACAIVSPDETIDLCFKRLDGPYSIWAKLGHGTWEELDLADLLIEINEAFGFDLSLDRWIAQLNGGEGIGRRLDRVPTWRQIAVVVVANARRFTATPRHILGAECLTAGVFESLCKIAAGTVRDSSVRIAPVDTICARMKSRMSHFRRRVEVNFGYELPPQPKSRTVARSVLLLGTIASVIVWCSSAFSGSVALIFGASFTIVFCIVSALLMRRFWPPFPAELCTFKALSRRIATEIQKQRTRLSA